MNISEETDKLFEALSKAQGELGNVDAKAKNTFFKSKYATLDDVIDLYRPILSKHGLGVIQLPIDVDGKPGLEVMVFHESGQYIGGFTSVELPKHDPQGFGSAWTYYRRYTAQAVLGIATKGSDDDGEAASKQYRKNTKKPDAAKTKNAGPSEKQMNRLYAIAKQSGYTETAQKEILVSQFNYKGSRQTMPWDIYDKFTSYMEDHPLDGDFGNQYSV